MEQAGTIAGRMAKDISQQESEKRSPKPTSPTPSLPKSDGRPAHQWESCNSIKRVLSREAEAEGGQMVVASVCPQCGGIGWVRSTAGPHEPEFGKLSQCPTCSEPARKRYLASMCGLEGRMMDLRFADWGRGNWTDIDQTEQERRAEQRRVAWKAIKDALEKRSGIHTFYGDFGSGKTHALAIIVNECRDKLIESYYAPLASVLDHLRSLYGQKRDTSEYWQRLLDVPVLALDEVTRFNATDWAMDKLFVLADTRYRRRTSHLTIFGTNDDPRKATPPGESIGYLVSRMREGVLVELRGDMRPAVKGAWWNE